VVFELFIKLSLGDFMSRKELNEDQYIAELNRRLIKHPEYTEGLEFMAYPPGPTGGDISGVAHSGFALVKAYIETINSVDQESLISRYRRSLMADFNGQ
jgi:hypothetical protein